MAEIDTPSPDLDTSIFDFHGLVLEPIADAVLSNTERQQLRELAEPGGPLHRIMTVLLGRKTVVERTFTRVNLFTPEGLAQMAALQAEAKALTQQYEMWQRMLTFIPPEPDEDQI